MFFVLVLIDEPKNAILAALLIHQLLNTSETVVISMIRLIREVDYNKSDKTFYFNDAVDYISNETNGILDLVSKVVPTPFSVNDDKAKEKYYQVTDSILNTIINGTAARSKVLAYIINHLEWNSNIVEIDYAEMHNLIKVNLRVITSAITYFCDNNIICRTNIKNIIVINHNLMFYGSIETFYKNYRLLCRNKPVIKGRKVILNK